MKCFHHHEKDAIGICKACSKGICPECAAEVGLSLACNATCVEEVAALDAQIQKARITLSAQKKNRMFMPALFMVLGSVFIAMDFYKTGGLSYRSVPGAVFALFGIAILLINQKWINEMEAKHKKAD